MSFLLPVRIWIGKARIGVCIQYQLAICINFNVSFGLQISKKIKRTPGGVDGAEILGKATDMYMTKTNNQKNNKRMPSLKLESALAELIEGGMVWTLDLAVQIIALVEITLFSQCFSSLTWWHCIDFCVEPYGRLGCIQNEGEGGWGWGWQWGQRNRKASV